MTKLQLPVFYAPNGKRWKRTRILAFSLIAFIAAFIGFFFFSLYITPFLPSFSIRAKPLVSQTNNVPDPAEFNSNEMPSRFELNSAENGHRPTTVGFYVNWDDTSYASLTRNIEKIDWFSPEWVRLQDGDNPLVLDFDEKALDLIHKEKPNMPILPLVQNYQDEVWN